MVNLMKNKKIFGLLMLILMVSGCCGTIEVPTPIPTTNRLTVLSDVTGEISIHCMNQSNDRQLVTMDKHLVEPYDDVYDLSRKSVEHSTVKQIDGMAVADTLVYPDLRGSYRIDMFTNDFTGLHECIINSITMRYHIKKYIDNQIVLDETQYITDWYHQYRWSDNCVVATSESEIYYCMYNAMYDDIDFTSVSTWQNMLEHEELW